MQEPELTPKNLVASVIFNNTVIIHFDAPFGQDILVENYEYSFDCKTFIPCDPPTSQSPIILNVNEPGMHMLFLRAVYPNMSGPFSNPVFFIV